MMCLHFGLFCNVIDTQSLREVPSNTYKIDKIQGTILQMLCNG